MFFDIAQRTLLVGVLTCASGCHVYQGAEIEGWVVDEQTKKPVQGAVVSTMWPIYGGVAHGTTVGNMLSQEVTTDSLGHFVLPAWGPSLLVWNALRDGAPHLIVSKTGYYFQVAGDDALERHSKQISWETRGCSCNKTTFSLRRFDGNWRNYADNAQVAELNLHLTASDSSLRCVWEKVPRLTSELIARAGLLSEQGIRNTLPTEARLGGQKCGDPKIMLKGA